MQPESYLRARKLLSSTHNAWIARVLGAVEALLILALLVTASLFISLMASRGRVGLPAEQADALPAWTQKKVLADESTDQVVRFGDSGILPLMGRSWTSPSPVHRLEARFLNGLTSAIPPMRNNQGALTTLLAAGLALVLLLALTSRLRRSLVARLAAEPTINLRNQIHRQMYRLGQSALPSEGVGPIANLWTREVDDVRDALLADFDANPRMIVLAGGLVILALLVSPVLTLFLVSLGLLARMAASRLAKDARASHDEALRESALQLGLLHEDLGLLRTARIYGVEESVRSRFDEHLEQHRDAEIRRTLADTAITTPQALLYGAAAVAALGLLGYNVLITDKISVATMLILLAALAGLAAPILQWNKARWTIRRADRSAEAIFSFLEREPELHQVVGAQFLAPMRDKITLEDVSLESRSGRMLLDRVSLDIPSGSRAVIIGQSEESKLAMACLIPRLIDPMAGHVLIDGRDLREMTLESVRAQVATVLQADLIFTDTIMANIGLGNARNTPQRVIEAAKVAHAHHFIQELPHGYDTQIGPLGHYLKPDEQFRIALARAFLHDPSILIVEEPTAHIDQEIKLLLDDTMNRLAIGRTLIIIAHRLSTIREADNVILLNNNKLEDIGPPSRLHGESKLFRHILYSEFNEYAAGDIPAGSALA